MYVDPFETISGSIKFKIGKGKKTPFLDNEVIRKCPKLHLNTSLSLATVIFEISVLELVNSYLPKIRQKCPWVSQFGDLCRRHSIELILWSMYFFARNREDRYSTYTQFYRVFNT